MAPTEVFRELHARGSFVMPNPWDAGTARYLAWRGFPAVATTSSGFAATLGRPDMSVTRDEVVAHVRSITAAVSIPVNVDAERCYADDPEGVAETVRLLAEAGAAGCSIEDYDPSRDAIDERAVAAERVSAAADEAGRHGLVLTARCENLIHGVDDLDDTIARLVAYRRAGAEVVYAPGLTRAADIRRVVEEVAIPVNVLATPAGPSIPELAALGVRRVSTGGALAWAAYGGLRRAVDELLEAGTSTYTEHSLGTADRAAAFAPAPR